MATCQHQRHSMKNALTMRNSGKCCLHCMYGSFCSCMQPCAAHLCHVLPGPMCAGHARKWPNAAGHAGSWPSGHDVLCIGCSSEGSLFYPWESPRGSPWLHATGTCTHQWSHPNPHALHGLLPHSILCSSVCRLGLSENSCRSDQACC